MRHRRCAGCVLIVDDDDILVLQVSVAVQADESFDELHAAGARAGLKVAGEVFADRAYTDKGTLVPRGQPGAVIHDHDELVIHVLRMLEAGGVVSQSGKVLPTSMDSICVHGDTLGAVESARHLRTELEARGWTIAPLPQLS